MQLPFRKSFWKKSSTSPSTSTSSSSSSSSSNKQRQKSVSSTASSSSNKSVHFSDSCSSIYYTYGSGDYDRGSDFISEDGHLDLDDSYEHIVSDNKEDLEWDAQVRKNTKVNQKRGHHSIAVLVQYRSNF